MPVFRLLKNPATYTPCSRENMLIDDEYRNYWLRHFESHFNTIINLALFEYGPEKKADIDSCRDDFIEQLHRIREKPDLYGELNLLVLDMIRQQKLHAYDLHDPFYKTKQRENLAMRTLYPALIRELDATTDSGLLLLLLVEGLFAGNIFDLGASATSARFASESPDFISVRDSLQGKRPWLVDQFDAFATRLATRPPYKKCLFFLDNAGSDFVLGVIPFVRHMALRGTQVILAANRLPALNDMTYRETVAECQHLGALDPVLADLLAKGRIRVADSGGVAPLIDLRHLSDEINVEAADADLVVLEGMGRGLESNFDAEFLCDSIKVCMIKETIVAQRHGGKLFDVVFRFDQAANVDA